MAEATDPSVQVKLLIGELVWTIANLEAQKAQLAVELAAALKLTPEVPVASL